MKSTFDHLGGSENRATPSYHPFLFGGFSMKTIQLLGHPQPPLKKREVRQRAPPKPKPSLPPSEAAMGYNEGPPNHLRFPGVEPISSTYKHVLHKPWYTVEYDGFGTTVAHSYRHFSYLQPLFSSSRTSQRAISDCLFDSVNLT